MISPRFFPHSVSGSSRFPRALKVCTGVFNTNITDFIASFLNKNPHTTHCCLLAMGTAHGFVADCKVEDFVLEELANEVGAKSQPFDYACDKSIGRKLYIAPSHS